MKRIYLIKIEAILVLLLFLCVNLVAQENDPSDNEDKIIYVTSEDSLMNEAIKKARTNLELFLHAFENKRTGQTNFAIKFPFKTKDNYEHIWLNKLKIKKGEIYGKVNNEPVYTQQVKLGDKVKIDLTQISDWMFFEEGKLKGGIRFWLQLKNCLKIRKWQ